MSKGTVWRRRDDVVLVAHRPPEWGAGAMTWLLPGRRLHCPYCFQPVSLGDCDVVSSRGSQEVLTPRPTGGWRKARARVWIRPVQGEHSVRELASWRCPHCGELLPANSDRADMVVIGLIGGAAAGKSHYLGALVQRLEAMADLQGIGCVRCTPANQNTVDRYRYDFHDQVFNNRHRLPVTAPIVEGQVNRPLIYTLLFAQGGRHRQREVNLVLYDGSGEQMVNQADMVEFHPYILHASGLILMVDPLGLPGIRPNLPLYLRDVPVDDYAPLQLLQSVITFYQQQKGLRADQPLDLPLAVTLAKADLLRFIPHSLTTPERLYQDSSYLSGVRPREFQATSNDVQEILRRSANPRLLALAGNFRHVSYHAVSATGGPATATDGTFPAISPTRCLDPLFWLLWQLGIARARATV